MKPSWMSDDDLAILEFLYENQSPTTAQLMAFHLGDEIKHGQIKQRLSALRKHGMVKRPDDVPEGLSARGVYVISDLGRRWVTGELTIKELRELDPTEGANDAPSD